MIFHIVAQVKYARSWIELYNSKSQRCPALCIELYNYIPIYQVVLATGDSERIILGFQVKLPPVHHARC